MKSALLNRHGLAIPFFHLAASTHPDRITPATEFTLLLVNDAIHSNLDLINIGKEAKTRSYTNALGRLIGQQLDKAVKSVGRKHMYVPKTERKTRNWNENNKRESLTQEKRKTQSNEGNTTVETHSEGYQNPLNNYMILKK